PDAELYAAGSEQFDRSSLQRMIEGATACALAWHATGEREYAAHGGALVRRWFIDPRTRMNPHLRFAQTIAGSASPEGRPTGVIEFRDIYVLLDAVRLLERTGELTDGERKAFADWLATYRNWLLDSQQGISECRTGNNHGTYFDLQSAAIDAYL